MNSQIDKNFKKTLGIYLTGVPNETDEDEKYTEYE